MEKEGASGDSLMFLDAVTVIVTRWTGRWQRCSTLKSLVTGIAMLHGDAVAC